MIDAIDSVLKGEATYPEAFKRANAFWVEFFAEHADETNDGLKLAIERAQIPFQGAMEAIGLTAPRADNILAVTCLGALYNDTFVDRDLARRVVYAMSTSRSLKLGMGSSAEEVRHLFNF